VRTLVTVTRDALFAAIHAAVAGNTIADIGAAVEKCVAPFGYGIVEELVGHGVGYKVHEPPQVPNYFVRANKSLTLVPGMVLALEPMINLGKKGVEVAADDWTIVTRDHTPSAHFEHTIIVTTGEPIIATLRPGEA
jgi:methionyl aminopeptidase